MKAIEVIKHFCSRSIVRCAIILGLLIFAFIIGYKYATLQISPEPPKNTLVSEIRESGYQFTNPLLECAQAEGRLNRHLLGFRSEIEEYVSNKKADGIVSDIGVYYRDLNNGPWFGVNERQDFLPASLLKLPLMLNFYKIAETRPQILQEKLTLQERFPLDGLKQLFPPHQEIQPGTEYTFEELLQRAIIFSDNQAAELMYTRALPHLESQGMLENAPPGINADLRYLESIFGENKEALSAKSYSTFFRILFNASYLDRLLSERALSILAQVEFPHGLEAGIPKDLPIAHKFGEAGSDAHGYELHDCGIIYYPKTPYLLCVMTKGKNPALLPGVIADISKIAYEQVHAQEPEKQD